MDDKTLRTDLAALETAARAATPGPWKVGYGPYGWDDGIVQADVEVTFGRGVIVTNSGHGSTSLSEQDAAYIAAVSPDVALSLIAYVRHLEKTLEGGQDAQGALL